MIQLTHNGYFISQLAKTSFRINRTEIKLLTRIFNASCSVLNLSYNACNALTENWAIVDAIVNVLIPE